MEDITALRMMNGGGTISLKTSPGDEIDGADWCYYLNGESLGQDDDDDPLIGSIWYCERMGYIAEPADRRNGAFTITEKGRMRLAEEYS